MLIGNLRYQGPFIAGLCLLLLLGSFAPDPLASGRANSSKPQHIFKSAYDYFRSKSRYVALAPFIRGSIGYSLSSSLSSRVYIGRNQHLYYGEDNATDQSVGDIYRPDKVIRFVDMAAITHRELNKAGADLIVALAPNAQSVAIEDLPARPGSKPLEYDLALTQLRSRGVKTSDVKSALLMRRDGNALYARTDTHWNNLGALLAFNRVVSDAGHPEWVVPESRLGPMIEVPGGDLSRFMGIQKLLSESVPSFPNLNIKLWKKVSILQSALFGGFSHYAYQRDDVEGARVLIVGDSFTQRFWLPFLHAAQGVESVAWLHHSMCQFDFEDVLRFRPNLVILIPTERYMPCASDRWPSGLPEK
ncbi:hypothetical protein AFEL58S_02694 [Afipia felis]